MATAPLPVKTRLPEPAAPSDAGLPAATDAERTALILQRLEAEERERLRRILERLIVVLGVVTLLAYLAAIPAANPVLVFLTVTALLGVEILSYALVRWNRQSLALIILTAGMWVVLFLAALVGEGLTNVPFTALLILVVMGGLLLGRGAGFVIAVINTLAGLVLLLLEQNGSLPAPLIPFDLTGYWISMGVISIAIAGLVSLYHTSLREMQQRKVADEIQREAVTRQLQEVRTALEEEVSRRTQELEQRSRYLQASFEVSRATASILETDRLIQEAVELIREQFNLYYVGLFLVDPSNEWAVLRAGTGEAGAAMLRRGHRIRIGSGMIGWCISNAEPRVALDVGADVVRLKTPELPDTQSEAAIPLRLRGRVLGALTVQSTQPRAFGEIEIAAFSAMADQLAIALENARLFQEGQQALEQIERAYGAASRQAWQSILRGQEALTYAIVNNIFQALPAPGETGNWSEPMRQALRTGRSVQVSVGEEVALYVPLIVRGEALGVMTFYKPVAAGAPNAWTQDETSLLENLVEQLGAALDSARLYEDTQRLAERERLTGEVTRRFRETLDIETILRTAVQEVQRTLGAAEVRVALRTPTPGNGGQSG